MFFVFIPVIVVGVEHLAIAAKHASSRASHIRTRTPNKSNRIAGIYERAQQTATQHCECYPPAAPQAASNEPTLLAGWCELLHAF